MRIIGVCAGFIIFISLAHGGAECASLGARIAMEKAAGTP